MKRVFFLLLWITVANFALWWFLSPTGPEKGKPAWSPSVLTRDAPEFRPSLSGLRSHDLDVRRLTLPNSAETVIGEALTRAEIWEIAERTALRHGLDPALIQAIISVESSFDPFAVSPKGAMGVMQLMPETVYSMGIGNPFNVERNIDGGVRYLKELLRLYRGNLPLALAAYNAGPTNIRRHRGIPPFAETREYVKKVIYRYKRLKNWRS